MGGGWWRRGGHGASGRFHGRRGGGHRGGGGRGGGNGPARFLGRRRLIHPLLDLLHGRRIETRQCAEFDVQPPFLNSLEQLLSLEPQFFRQLVNTRGQRQLLPESTPDGREDHDPGNGFV